MACDSVYVRHIDELGRVVIPAEIRQQLGLTPGSAVDISVTGNSITVQAQYNRCALCGGTLELSSFNNSKHLCKQCLDHIVKTFSTCD